MPIYALGNVAPDLPPEGQFWVAPDASLIGRVRLGVDVGVWFGCVLRGDNEWISVGARSNVQEGTVMHTDPGAPLEIGDGCTIGHRAILHGCIIGDNTLIGMGATVLNRVRIGKNCLVGANALVTEGKEFPDNSLIVGSPAKAVRVLDEAAVEGLRRSADRYVENWKRFARDLRDLSRSA
jgi:carbonic anhydrase/acetyltransferase-like protein (isoleucine patch superfamily)